MLHEFIVYIGIILLILFLVMLSEKLKVAYPIILVLGGLAVSLIPGIPEVTINHDMIFVIFLPPLLYEAAWYTSWKDLWKFRRVISSFAFLIVIVTSLVVALFSSYMIPGFTLALGFLLGGIVSPPDAVSATSVLKYVKIPKALSTIIEGESLLNDASSLIIFRFALAAVITGTFSIGDASVDFLKVIILGVGAGVAIGFVFYAIHRWLPTNTNVDIVLTLTAPYVMYIAAESFHVSGVLAVVSGGLFLSSRSHLILSHRSRLSGANVWSTLGFVLNGLVFILIGLELPVILRELGSTGINLAIRYGIAITVVLIVTRILCTLGSSVFTVFASKFIKVAVERPGWRGPLVIGWAGMRGVVSLAAALSIPVYASQGVLFPQRNLILFITFIVILLTLVVQGLTLPWVIKVLKVGDENQELTTAQSETYVRTQIAQQSMEYLRQKHGSKVDSNVPLQHLVKKIKSDASPADDNVAEKEKHKFAEVYLDLLEQQRLWLAEIDKNPEIEDAVIRRHQSLVDLEEEKISVRYLNSELRS
ncbi:MAG: Na+/H+ antiporter [Flavitalea sp.]